MQPKTIPEPPRVQQAAVVPSAQPEKVQNEYAAAKGVDDPLSPKRLERMMRVTISDRNPLG